MPGYSCGERFGIVGNANEVILQRFAGYRQACQPGIHLDQEVRDVFGCIDCARLA